MRPFTDRILDLIGWPDTWGREWPAGILLAILCLLGAAVTSTILLRLVATWLRGIAQRTTSDLDDRLLDLVDRPIRRLILLGGVYWAVIVLPLGKVLRDVCSGIIYVVAVFLAVKTLIGMALALLQAVGHRFPDPRDRLGFEKDYLPLLTKLVRTVLAVIGLISVLHHFGQEVTSLVAALGIGGIAVGFAAKDTLGNMLAGFMILADRPFRTGDRIKLATGEIGDVLAIGTRSTRVKLLDSNLLVVPNTELVNARVVNFNSPTAFSRGQLDVGVAYGTDVEQAKRAVQEILDAQPEIAKEPPSSVILAGFGDSALLMTAWYHVTDYATLTAVNDRVRVKVYERFARDGIKIPYPTHEVLVTRSTGSDPLGR